VQGRNTLHLEIKQRQSCFLLVFVVVVPAAAAATAAVTMATHTTADFWVLWNKNCLVRGEMAVQKTWKSST
jgi:hypothetical protein